MRRILLTNLYILFIIFNLFGQEPDKDYSYALFSSMYLRNQIVEGRISGFEGLVKLDPSNIAASSIQITADVSTLNTGYINRDTTLQGQEFLEITKYPKIKFQSTSFEPAEKGYSVTGNLTIKDKTEEIKILFTIKEEERRILLDGSFQFNRFDYSIGENISTISVGEDVDVKIRCIIKTK